MFKKALALTLAATLAALAGCASDPVDEQPPDEAVPAVEADGVDTNAAQASCPPPGTCRLASIKCNNPRTGGTYCNILMRCLDNNCPFN